MAKIKLCPNCGAHNSTTAIECECGEDLSGVPATDEETLNNPPATPCVPLERKTAVRVCDECGHRNPANTRKCERCGSDISDIAPTTEVTSEERSVRLIGIDGQPDFIIPMGETVIGKEYAMSRELAGKAYVSRRHGAFTREDGKLYYENFSKTNFTYINNVRTVSGKTELKNGDILGLGGNEVNGVRQDKAAYYKVRIAE